MTVHAKAKSKPVISKPVIIDQNVEPSGNRGKLIKALIIGGTFGAIAALSILAQGNGNGWPAPSVIAIRFGLLSACSLVYFWMLYRTKAARDNNTQKPQPRKK